MKIAIVLYYYEKVVDSYNNHELISIECYSIAQMLIRSLSYLINRSVFAALLPALFLFTTSISAEPTQDPNIQSYVSIPEAIKSDTIHSPDSISTEISWWKQIYWDTKKLFIHIAYSGIAEEVRLALLAKERGDLHEATIRLQNLLECDSLTVIGRGEIHFQQGTCYFLLNQFNKAIFHLDSSTLYNCQVHWATHMKGICYSELNDRLSSIELYDGLIAADSSDAVAWFNRGVSYEHLNDFNTALDSYNYAKKLDPNYTLAWSSSCKILLWLNRIEESRECYASALELNPADIGLWIARGDFYLEVQEPESSVNCFEHSLGLNSKNALAWFKLGNALQRTNDLRRSAICFEKAVKISPNVKYWNNLGAVHNQLEEYEPALNCFDHALECDSSDYITWYNRGVAYYGLGRYSEAVYCLDQANNFKKDFSMSWCLRGQAFLALEDYREAKLCFQKGCSFGDSLSADQWLLFGHAYRNLADPISAIRCYEMAIRSSVQNPESWFYRGVCLSEIGKYDRAIESLRLALFERPDYFEAKLAISRIQILRSMDLVSH